MAEHRLEVVATAGTPSERSDDLLRIENLSVAFPRRGGWMEVVRSASLTVRRGQTVALVGESGSGKTVTSLAAIGLLDSTSGRVAGGTIAFDGHDVTHAPEATWLALRGRRIGMVFQQPTRSLDPAFTVGDQIAEAVRVHNRTRRREAWSQAVAMLDRVHIPRAAEVARSYPHTLSGGMCQRVAIAIALVCSPELLIADEPTTALDVTVQARILELLAELQADTGVSILYITHDLGVVSDMCDDVAVMYAGQIVERGAVADVFTRPQHPYTEGLLASVLQPGAGKRMATIGGQVPPPQQMPSGCTFHPRCPYARAGICDVAPVALSMQPDGGAVRCALHGSLEMGRFG